MSMETEGRGRNRKRKGELSILGEFDESTPASITSSPSVDEKAIEQIKTTALLADLPAAIRARKTSEVPHPLEHEKTSLFMDQIKGKSRSYLDQNQSNSGSNLDQISGVTQPKVSFSLLVGIQRAIVHYIYLCCKSIEEDTTDPITSDQLAQVANTTVITVQSAVKRLIEKRILSRVETKVGPGGWTRYYLAKSIYQEICVLEAKGRLKPNFL